MPSLPGCLMGLPVYGRWRQRFLVGLKPTEFELAL
jgi:hypothetical protein